MFWLASSLAVIFLALGIAAARPFDAGMVRRATATVGSSQSAVSAPVFRADATNLLVNASFEMDSDANGLADGWSGDPTSGTYSVVGEARFGLSSQSITKSGIADPIARFSALQQRVSGIMGGRRYEVGVDYRYVFGSAPDVSRSVGIVVYSLDEAGRFIDAGTSADWGWPSTSAWVRKGLTFRVPANCVALIVEFRLSVNGSVWWDGASLRETEP